MNGHRFTFCGTELVALAAGALWWPGAGLLCVSDLHLGKSGRIARRSGAMLPPYDSRDTLARLETAIEAVGARRVVCLGDSFDDLLCAEDLADDLRLWLLRLASGRDWVWIAGNHDPGPPDLPGSHVETLLLGPLGFRHIARAAPPDGSGEGTKEASGGISGEVSGHYHPKARLFMRGTSVSRPCFLIDDARVLMPAFGTYTGGLCCTSPVLDALMAPGALAVLTGPAAHVLPMPRPDPAPRARRTG